MSHDKNGKLVQVGDVVAVEFKVKSVMGGEDFCNCSLESIIPMLPTGEPCSMSLNLGQTELVDPMEETKAELLGTIDVLQKQIVELKNLKATGTSAPPASNAHAATKGAGFEVRGHAILRLDPPAKKA